MHVFAQTTEGAVCNQKLKKKKPTSCTIEKMKAF